MTTIGYILLIIYTIGLAYIMLFCLMQFHLLYHYKRYQFKNKISDLKTPEFKDILPMVTIQLPVYNERFVIERLIDCVCAFDYPKERFEIQILDDSADETTQIALIKQEEYRQKGFNIEVVRRTDRLGYKAGALQEGMKRAKGEFIAIFDADFLPTSDFLQKTIPHFEDNNLGVVQSRWAHLNENYSIITKLQAFQLNVHFTVEQQGRYSADYLLQFNGTAGVWRKTAIEAAGGWEADTLTEDLDLSIRAQLKGWKIKYLEGLNSPAELPAEMNGLKSQQFRWMKGGAETAKKMLPPIWKSDLSIIKKFHATAHLLSSSIFLWVFIVGVFSVPVLFLLEPLGISTKYFAIFLSSLMAIVSVYYVANVQSESKEQFGGRTVIKFIFLFPIFLALSMGLSLHNSVAVIQGYLGKKSPFIRTPKFNINVLTEKLSKNEYFADKIPVTTIFEGILAFYFLLAIIISIKTGNTTFLLFHILLAIGYGSICYFSIKHLRIR